MFVGPYTTRINCPHGRPSIVVSLPLNHSSFSVTHAHTHTHAHTLTPLTEPAEGVKDRSVIQLYSKATGIYLGLRVSGDVIGMTNPDND